MGKRSMRGFGACAILAITLAAVASAQSLDPKAPTPLKPGANRGTLDNMVGPQYWSFNYKKGPGNVSVSFTSMGLFGNPTTTTIQVVLYIKGQVAGSRDLTSNGHIAKVDIAANFTESGTVTVELRPTGSNLVRAGGDYTVAVTGAGIDFAGSATAESGAQAGPERIVGTYSVMVCAPDFDCQSSLAIRFAANGTVQTTDGHSGTWKIFDPDALIYSVVMGPDRWSLKLIPGRGLFNTSDLSVVVFQAVRPR